MGKGYRKSRGTAGRLAERMTDREEPRGGCLGWEGFHQR